MKKQRKLGFPKQISVVQADDPAPINTVFRVRKTAAWQVNGTVGSPTSAAFITNKNLMDAVASVAISATAAVQLFSAIKVHKATLYIPPAGLSTVQQGLLEFPGSGTTNISGPSNRRLDVTVGDSQIGKVSRKPTKDSSQAFWQSSSTFNFLQLQAVAGCVLYIDFSADITDGTPINTTAALVGATSGLVYQLGLDGLPQATSKYIPLGYPTA